jgi:hypothetical protein
LTPFEGEGSVSAGESTQSNWLWRRRVVRAVVTAAVAAVLLSLLFVIASSRVPMRGAELFGAVANKIKGHPGATAYISLGAGAALWIGLAALAAGQELLARRRT